MRPVRTFVAIGTIGAVFVVLAAFGATACTFLVSFDDPDAATMKPVTLDGSDPPVEDASIPPVGDLDAAPLVMDAAPVNVDTGIPVSSSTLPNTVPRAGAPAGSTVATVTCSVCPRDSLEHWKCLDRFDTSSACGGPGTIIFCDGVHAAPLEAYNCPSAISCEHFGGNFEDSCNPCIGKTGDICDFDINSSHQAYSIACASNQPVVSASQICTASCTNGACDP